MNELSYTAAFEELQKIVAEIEEGSINIDQLSEKVKRAALLIQLCKNKLHATEEDIGTILREMDAPIDTKNSTEDTKA